MSRTDIIDRACHTLLDGRINSARDILRTQYPFVPSVHRRKTFSKHESMRIFCRDAFVDRYSGMRLVNPGALRVLSLALPDDFPYHPHGHMKSCHIAFWELLPSVDHLVPLSRNGRDDDSNYVTTSMRRNVAKMESTLDEIGWRLHEPGDFHEWDGMSRWLMDYVDKNSHFLENSYVRDYYRATKRALNEVGDG